jgi:peptidoglycan/xylan/chitin deacetylase (PgdA/CDA1 family)
MMVIKITSNMLYRYFLRGVLLLHFFVVAGVVGEKEPISSAEGHRLYPERPMMTKQDITTLIDSGMEIGSHTVTHQMATKVLSRSLKELEHEVKQSKHRLEDMTGVEISSFSYPNGQKGAFSNQNKGAFT